MAVPACATRLLLLIGLCRLGDRLESWLTLTASVGLMPAGRLVMRRSLPGEPTDTVFAKLATEPLPRATELGAVAEAPAPRAKDPVPLALAPAPRAEL